MAIVIYIIIYGSLKVHCQINLDINLKATSRSKSPLGGFKLQFFSEHLCSHSQLCESFYSPGSLVL